MADSILNIVIRARDETQAAFVQIQQQLKGIQESVKGLGGAKVGTEAKEGIDGIGESAAKSSNSLKTFSKQSEDTAAGLEVLGSIAKRVIGVFAGFFTISYVKSLADGAARTEVLGTVLTQVANNAGITEEQIKKVDKSVQALGITAESSRQSLSQFIQSGLDITKAASLARAAQDLAVISGRDSSQTFAQMIVSIQQMNTVSLRFMGIIVNMEEATAKYAAANGLAASAIDRTTKQQIMLDEVLEQSMKLQGLYEASMSNVGKQLQSLSRYQKEASDSAGQLLLPAYLVLVQEFTLFLKQITLSTEGMNAHSTAGANLAAVLKPIASSLREIALFVKNNAVAMAELAAVIYILINRMAILNVTLTFLAGGFSMLLKGIQFAALAWRGFMILLSSNPIGLVVTTVTLLTTALISLWNIFKDKAPENATEQLADNYRMLIDLAEKHTRAVQAVEEARKGIGDKSLQDALAEEEAIKGQQKELKAKNEALEKSLKLTTAQAKANMAAAEAEAANNKVLAARRDELRNIEEALRKVGLFGESARKGLDIKESFAEMLSTLDKFVVEYQKGFDKTGKATTVTQGQIDLMVKKIAEGATTTDEMNAAMERLGNEGNATKSKLDPLLLALEMKRVQAGFAEAQKALANFVENASAGGMVLKTLGAVEDAARQSAVSLATELSKIGVAASQQGSGISALAGVVQVTAQTMREAAASEVRALEETAKAINKRYQNELAQVQATKTARIEAASAVVGNSKGAEKAILDAEKKAAGESLALAKTKFDGLIQLQNRYLAAAIATRNELKRIDEEIYNSKKTLEEKLFALTLKGKSEEEQQALIRERISKVAAEAEAARMKGNFELAKKLNDERIAMVDKLSVPDNATEQQKAEVEKQLVDAYGQQNKILEDQKRIKQEALELQTAGYDATTKQLADVTKQLAAFADTQIVKLSVELDAGSLTTVANQIRDALNDITITLKTKTAGFASGGLVLGPGTTKSDSILAALSNREFVMNADAVDRYGVGFMQAINQMTFPSIPRFATGGLVGSSAANDSAVVGNGSREVVDVNLNLGGQKISLMGERTQVRRLVSSLKNLQGV